MARKKNEQKQPPSVHLPGEIEHWEVGRLSPYSRNARTHSYAQIQQIMDSILQFGFTNPLLVNAADGEIIAGHGRLEAALRLGLPTVPVIPVDHLSEAQRRALVIADNQIALNAGWDEELLAREIAALRTEDFDIGVLGFSTDELDRILGGAGGGGGGGSGEPDAAPPAPKVPVTRYGDVWHLGAHRVMCGESRDPDNVEILMGLDRAACVWTDPPYNVAYRGNAGTIINDDQDDKAFEQFLRDALGQAARMLQPGGSIYVAHPDGGVRGALFRSVFCEYFKLASVLIWRKNAGTLGWSDYLWRHEPIMYGWKEDASHSFHGGRKQSTVLEFDEPAFAQTGENEWQINLGEDTLVIRGEGLTVERLAGTVFLEEKPRRSLEHPTMKPTGLISRQLLNSAKRGDVVLDLFGGSGSTLIACEQLGMKARLMELDPRFVDVIVRRWQDFTGEKAILEGIGALFDDVAVAR